MANNREKRTFFLRASLPRALVETLLLGWLGLWGLLARHEALGGRLMGQAIFFYVPLVSLWYAVRLRVRLTGSLARQSLNELVATLALSPLVAGLWLALIWGLGLDSVLVDTLWNTTGTSLLILGSAPFFVVFRIGVRLWLIWERLRSRRLVWALTHTQLQLVILFAVLAAIVASLMLVIPDDRPLWDLDTWVFTLLPFLGITGAMTLAGIAAVIPPALFLAWLTARRTTRRLESLTTATTALRQGDYSTQIPVEGEDEVAQLQRDFNAMATALDTAMRDLQAERDKVAALLEARRQLVISVSHELRTPLATVRGYLESVQENANTDQVLHDLSIMDRELDRLQTLIDDLFTLSRAEVGKLDLALAPVDLHDLIRRRVDATASLAWRRERVRVIADLPETVPPARTDAARLEQVLVNLVRNALRHTPPGGIVVITAGTAGEEVWVRVSDTGEGIAPGELTRIWERFYRGGQARNQDSQGAGLGLALVKELTEAMDGRVTVESTVGAGSSFTIYLPCHLVV